MDKRLSTLQRILNGDIFTSKRAANNYRWLAMIGVFVFISVLMGFISEWQHVNIAALKKDLLESRNIELTINSELVSSTRQSAVAKSLKENGSKVREANKPIVVVE